MKPLNLRGLAGLPSNPPSNEEVEAAGPVSIALDRARLTLAWRKSRADRQQSLIPSGATSMEDAEEAEYLYQMAMLDVREIEEKEQHDN